MGCIQFGVCKIFLNFKSPWLFNQDLEKSLKIFVNSNKIFEKSFKNSVLKFLWIFVLKKIWILKDFGFCRILGLFITKINPSKSLLSPKDCRIFKKNLKDFFKIFKLQTMHENLKNPEII